MEEFLMADDNFHEGGAGFSSKIEFSCILMNFP